MRLRPRFDGGRGSFELATAADFSLLACASHIVESGQFVSSCCAAKHTRAFLFIGVTLSSRLPSFHLKSCNAVSDQETRALVKANHWIVLIIFESIKIKYLLQVCGESRIYNPYAAGLSQMRSKFVFLRIFLGAACDKRLQWPSSTALSASAESSAPPFWRHATSQGSNLSPLLVVEFDSYHAQKVRQGSLLIK